MRKNKKICALLAFLTAASMLSAGCSNGGDAGNGKEPAEGTSVSINVIGGDKDESAPAAPGDALLDENGQVMTGVNGDVLTAPTATFNTDNTLSPDEIADAMTATTPAPQLNLTQTTTERYGYSTLNAEEKKLYDAIVAGVQGLRYKVCREDEVSLETWAKVYGIVYNQEPQLFYMSSKIKVGKLYYLTKDPDAINEMQKSIDAVANKIVAEANAKSTTYDKLKVFHDYLVLNSSFELKADDSGYNSTIYNAFGTGAAQGNIQCSGYAKAMQYLCDKAGITSMVVTGETTEGRSHAWNVVNVDGVWYNLDCTWDDPLLKTPNYKNIRWKYFLVPDKGLHNITHMHVNQKRLSSGKYITYFQPPACTSDAQSYFVKTNQVYSDFDSADKALRKEIERAVKDGSRTAEIAVNSKSLYDQLYKVRMDYNDLAKSLGAKGVADECTESMLVVEFDVIYNS